MRTIHIYQAKDGWRWRTTAKGRIVEESGEAYVTYYGAMRAVKAKLRAAYRVVGI